jgi:hypothetical protein
MAGVLVHLCHCRRRVVDHRQTNRAAQADDRGVVAERHLDVFGAPLKRCLLTADVCLSKQTSNLSTLINWDEPP